MRRIGLSPWMRNIFSVWVKKAGAYHSTKGGLTECTFFSHNITSNERLLANQAYTLGNKAHHIGESPEDDPSGAWTVYARGVPDGVVNAVPDYLDRLGDKPTDELLLDIIWRALEHEADGDKRAFLNATLEIIAEQAPAFPFLDLPGKHDIATIVDIEKHRARVVERLTWQWSRVQFQQRKAPKLGESIEIVVRKQLDPDPPVG